MNRKRWLCVLLAALIAVTLLPAAAFAAGGVTVTVGGTPLNEGANSIGWCTAMPASPTRSGTCGCAIRAQTSKMVLWARPSMPASAWRTRSIYKRGPAP